MKVVDIEVREGRERRRGVVMFKREEEARKAVQAMDGGSIDLQQIVVSFRFHHVALSRELQKTYNVFLDAVYNISL